MKRTVSYFSLLVAMSLLVFACMKDDLYENKVSTRFKLEPGIAIPIGKGSLTINDMLARFDTTGAIKEYNSGLDSGLLYMSYSSEFISLPASAIVTLPDQIYDQFFIKSDFTIPPVFDSLVTSKHNDYAFTFGSNERIDSMSIKQGTLQLDLASSFRNTGVLEITSNNIVRNGQPFKQRIVIGNASGNYTSSNASDLSGYTIHFVQNNDTAFIPFDFKLTLYNSVNPIRATDSVNLDFVFENLDYKVIYGDIGYKTFLNEAGNISLNLFENNLGGNIDFANPQLLINVKNSYGIPVKIELNDLRAHSEKNPDPIDISFPPGENSFAINFPGLHEIGQAKETEITFDNITPSMSDVINEDPTEFTFSASGYSDTLLMTQEGFIVDTSNFLATVEVLLPMWFRAGDFALEDTVEFDFAKTTNGKTDLIKDFFFHLAVENGLPVDVRLQVYFADAAYQVVDSMFHDDLPQVSSGVLDSNYKVSESTHKDTEVDFTTDRLNKLTDVKWAFIRASLTTTDYTTNPALMVKFYSSYKLNFNLYVRTRLNITSENL